MIAMGKGVRVRVNVFPGGFNWPLFVGREKGFFAPEDNVVLFNTGSGLKYLDVIESQKQVSRVPASRQIGGIIGPF